MYLVFTAVSMVMKSSAEEEEEGGWGLGVPEKTRNNANWVNVTQEFKGACRGVYASSVAYYHWLNSAADVTVIRARTTSE